MEKQESHSIGKPLPRVDAPAKVSGETRFVTDMVLDRMVYAYPVVSPVPHGRIRGIDTSPATTLSGVLDVILADRIPGKNQVGVILEDQPLLADERVRFVGDVVGVAVAETDALARHAAAEVRVDCEELPTYFSIGESRVAERDLLHETQIACTHRVIKGDVEAGFGEADLVVEADFRTPYQEHFYLEPQGCIAVPEEGGGMTLYGSLQCPFYVQKAVAKVLDLPFNRVRVIQTPIGGAFGGKEDVPSEVCARTALAARCTGRPVKMIYRRRDDVQWTSKRHPFEMHYKVGVTRDGRLVAAEVRLDENAGAYATLSSVVSYRATMQALGPYVVPNVRVNSTAWYTNLPPAGAFRGFGSPQATFGHERMMDVVAEKLGMDPLEFRLKNLITAGGQTQTGQTLNAGVGVRETLDRAADAAKWPLLRNRTNDLVDGRYLEGVGLAVCHYGNCLGAAGWAMDGAGARIQVRRDGSIAVAFGLTEMGQGALTVVTQMTAEALGVHPDRIAVMPTDTQNVPDSGPSVASRNVVMTGNAIRDAAGRLMPILKKAAAELFECEPEAVAIEDDEVRNTGSSVRISFTELADYLYISNAQMDTLGWWHVPKLKYDPDLGQGEAYFAYSFATHVAKVRVDTLTGLVQVEKLWAAHDVGRAINPAGLQGQVEGGTAQGAGWALTEHFQTDGGHVRTANLSTYLLPTSRDVPEVETLLVEDPEPLGPWGAKGIGEPAIIPTGAAIANAVSHALSTQIHEIPVVPERVLDTLLERKNR